MHTRKSSTNLSLACLLNFTHYFIRGSNFLIDPSEQGPLQAWGLVHSLQWDVEFVQNSCSLSVLCVPLLRKIPIASFPNEL